MAKNLPLVLLHGFGSGSYTWKGLLNLLNDRKVLTPELPGGNVLEQARFLEGLRIASGIDSFEAIGHSMGATTLAAYSLFYPHLQRIILESPADDLAPTRLMDRMASLPVLGNMGMHLLPVSVF